MRQNRARSVAALHRIQATKSPLSFPTPIIMPISPATLRQFLAGAALAVSVSSIGYLLLDHPPADGSISELNMKISRIESGLAALQSEQRVLKEEGRLLLSAFESRRGTASQDEESSTAAPRPASNTLASAHGNWLASEYQKIVEKSLANASSMISVLSNETSISKDKLMPMRNVFSEASIRIANVLVEAQGMNDMQGIPGKISEINQWKDDTLSTLLSKEEFDQYKSINWMKKLGPGDRK
jgi:hypothetical protein